MVIKPYLQSLVPCHILEIQFLDETVGIRGAIYTRYFFYFPESNISSEDIYEKENYVKLRGRKYNDSEKRMYSLTTFEALKGYIRLYNYNLRKILKIDDMDERLERLDDFYYEGFHHLDFSRAELE